MCINIKLSGAVAVVVLIVKGGISDGLFVKGISNWIAVLSRSMDGIDLNGFLKNMTPQGQLSVSQEKMYLFQHTDMILVKFGTPPKTNADTDCE